MILNSTKRERESGCGSLLGDLIRGPVLLVDNGPRRRRQGRHDGSDGRESPAGDVR